MANYKYIDLKDRNDEAKNKFLGSGGTGYYGNVGYPSVAENNTNAEKEPNPYANLSNALNANDVSRIMGGVMNSYKEQNPVTENVSESTVTETPLASSESYLSYMTPSYGQYNSAYAQQIADLTNQILGRDKFSYDYTQDPLYQQYAEQYTRNGQNAMRDTMAQLSARTGGLGSSYANVASQQAYNDYMQALNDTIPDLYQLAYNRYNNDTDTLRNNLSMIQGMDNTAYDRWADSQSRYNSYVNSYNDYLNDLYGENESNADTSESSGNKFTMTSEDEGIVRYNGVDYTDMVSMFKAAQENGDINEWQAWLNKLPEANQDAVMNEIKKLYGDIFYQG